MRGIILKKLIIWLDNHFEGTILKIMMGYFVFATFFQVIARFVFKISAPWTEESARYVFIWMTFIGASYAASKSNHIRMDLIETKISKKYRFLFRTMAMSIFLLFTAIICKVGIDICLNLLVKPQISSVLKLPMIYVYGALPVGMFLTSIRIVESLIKDYKRFKREGKV